MEKIISHLEQIIRKSIVIYLEGKSIWKIFFLPFFILMLLSLILLLFPYSQVFAGASFLRFDLYPETGFINFLVSLFLEFKFDYHLLLNDFIIFVVILLAILCIFSYCAIVTITITKNYITSGKIEFALNNFEGKLLSVISSYITLFILASLATLIVVWLQALEFGILTFFVKLAILAIWFVIFLIFWFVPQAIVVDDRSLASAMSASTKFVSKDFKFILIFLAMAGIAMEILYLFGSLHWTLLGIVYAVNFMLLLPLLIVIQTAIYITRYTLRGISLEQ